MRPYQGGVRLAEVVRSGFVEGFHDGSFAVVDASGTLIAAAGDARGALFPRSSNKPMQAVAMLRSGLSLVDSAELAVVAASHSGEPFHLERIRSILRGGGLTEAQLLCPPDLPLDEHARADVIRAGGVPSRIFMNCSGKHAGMLRTCQAAGWSTEDYVDPGHPLQKASRTAVEELTGEPVTAIGVDGCGAPVLSTSLLGLARAFLAVVSAEPATPGRAVADAMRAHPELVSGTGRLDADLMRAVPGLLSKGGAEGVLAVAIPDVGAVAIKIDDGSFRPHIPVLQQALAHLNVALPLEPPPVLGGGERVGTIRGMMG
jgi:L-asparaginase II